MRAWIIGGLSAAMGWASLHAYAQDAPSRAANAAPAFQRVHAPAEASVTLNRPVPLRPAAEEQNPAPGQFERTMPIFRAKALDNPLLPQLMPVGPTQQNDKQNKD